MQTALGSAAKQTAEESKETRRFPLAPASSTTVRYPGSEQDWSPLLPKALRLWDHFSPLQGMGQAYVGDLQECVCVSGGPTGGKVTVYNTFPVT